MGQVQLHRQQKRPAPRIVAVSAAGGDNSTSSSPDTTKTTKQLTDTYNANNTITAYAHSLQNILLVWNTDTMGPVPAWFTGLSASLAVAQGHGQTWVDNLGPMIFSTVPQTIISYTNTFTTDMGAVMEMINALPPGTPPTQSQQASINAILNNVLSTMQTQTHTLTDVHTQLVAFATDVQGDHTALVTGANSAQNAVIIDEGQLTKIQGKINLVNAEIKSDSKAALASEIGIGIGVFIVIVGVVVAVATDGAAAPLVAVGIGVLATGAAIAGTVIFSKKVNGDIDQLTQLQQELTDEQRQVSALIGITNSTDALVKANEAATKAISDVLDMWQTLEGKLSAVVTQLENAEAADVPAIVEGLDIETAQTAWGQLAAFCTQMQSNAVTVQPPITNAPTTDGTTTATLIRAGLPRHRPVPRPGAR